MSLSITMNLAEVNAAVKALFRSQLPYATMRAINAALLEIQTAERAEMRDDFTIRQPRFADLNVKIPRGGFATKSKLSGEMRLAAPGGQERPSLFSPFEAGGTRRAKTRESPLAVPSKNIRPSESMVVPRALYPTNLRLVPRKDISGGALAAKKHTTKRGVVQLKGKRRTFVLDPATMFGVQVWGVYQRTGKKRGDIRLLWTYRMGVKQPRLYPFSKVAERLVAKRYEALFDAAFAEAIRTAR